MTRRNGVAGAAGFDLMTEHRLQIVRLHERADQHQIEMKAVRDEMADFRRDVAGVREEFKAFREMAQRYFRDLLLAIGGTLLTLTADPVWSQIGATLKEVGKALR